MQLPSVQTCVASSQVMLPQQSPEWEQCSPWPKHEPMPSSQTPFSLQSIVPQQSDEVEQWFPWPKHEPSSQTLLPLQVRMPQQSMELLQWAPLPSQGTTTSGGAGGTS